MLVHNFEALGFGGPESPIVSDGTRTSKFLPVKVYSPGGIFPRACPGSAPMRRWGLIGSARFEIVGWGLSGKSAEWSVMIVEVLETVEDRIKNFDGTRQRCTLLTSIPKAVKKSVKVVTS